MDRVDPYGLGLYPDFRCKINIVAGRADAGADHNDQIPRSDRGMRTESTDSGVYNAEFCSFFSGVKQGSGGAIAGDHPNRGTICDKDSQGNAARCGQESVGKGYGLRLGCSDHSHAVPVNLLGRDQRVASQSRLL